MNPNTGSGAEPQPGGYGGAEPPHLKKICNCFFLILISMFNLTVEQTPDIFWMPSASCFLLIFFILCSHHCDKKDNLRVLCKFHIFLTRFSEGPVNCNFTEEGFATKSKQTWFFAYNLRMNRDTNLTQPKLTSAHQA